MAAMRISYFSTNRYVGAACRHDAPHTRIMAYVAARGTVFAAMAKDRKLFIDSSCPRIRNGNQEVRKDDKGEAVG